MARSNEKLKAVVPLSATAVDAIKGIYNVLSYYREPLPRTQLDILLIFLSIRALLACF